MTMRAGRGAGGGDGGSTLVETLVALSLVMTAMGAMGTFFVNSFLIVATQRTEQDAAQLANSAISQVRALKGSSLVSNRGFARTDSQWCSVPFPASGGALSQLPLGVSARGATCAANAATPYLLGLQEVWDPMITDPASTLGDDAAVSTATQTMSVDNLTFLRTIYVGACDIYVNSTSNCVNSTVVTAPANSTRDLEFFRAVVLVTWAGHNCPGDTCSYVASTLVSRGSEPQFDFHRPSPLVTTVAVTFYRNTSTTFALAASGGQLPNTWTASPLPPGLTVTPAGVISGTPTALGTTTSTVTVTDKLGRSDSRPVAITVTTPLALTVPGNTVSHVGDTITLAASATGGIAPLTYSATGLPPGLTLNPGTGAITGTVTTAGSYRPVTITVTDSNATLDTPSSLSGTYDHVVWPVVAVAAVADRQFNLASAVSVPVAGSGGDGNLAYAASGLPPGVTINAGTGLISGQATATGRYLPTVTVTDGSGGTARVSFALEIDSSTALVFTSPSPSAPDQADQVGRHASLTLDTNGNALGLNPTITVTGLPPGLSLNAQNDKISGQPTAAGTYPVTVVATNAAPAEASSVTFVWKIT